MATSQYHPSANLRFCLLCSCAVLALMAPARAQSILGPCGLLQPPAENAIFNLSIGTQGQGGPGSTFEGPGHAGTQGGPGASLTYGATTPLNWVALLSEGGNGGNGSNAGSGDPAGSNGGGVGVPGGQGGNVTITTSAPVMLPSSAVGTARGAVCAYSAGGIGGEAGLSQNSGPRHPSGHGGGAGTVSVTIGSAVTSAVGGVIAWSVGGAGGDGKANTTAFGTYAGQAGPGAAGGEVDATVTSTIGSAGIGVSAASGGGNGGTGGDNGIDGGTNWKAGAGGDGGDGGPVTVTLSGSIATDDVIAAPGILAQSYGGLGGAGGGGGGGAPGGLGGLGGPVTINLGGTITTQTDSSPGVVAQSFGGQGAPGGSGTSGGAGGAGGDGGTVTVQSSNGSITTGMATVPSEDAPGVLAQSVGGGGAWGGNAIGSLTEIGGTGGVGAAGSTVTVNLQTAIQTYGSRSQGILAQSIGGGGGTGGDATGAGTIFDLTVGGSGAGGGDGGQVNAFSSGTIATAGEQSPGILLQSIGGGGGAGGSGYGSVHGEYFGMQISLGGTGAGAGNGGTIGLADGQTDTNAGVIWTSGAESAGILAQSIGGGGGKGGPSSATAISQGGAGGGYLSVVHSIGGSGGSGGDGRGVTLENGGMILASGAGSRGILAQSIGGGGGDGGDAKATSNAGKALVPIDIQDVVGGTIGSYGSGEAVSIGNAGLVVTTGADGDAILAQSIGGGGGTTGAGDGTSTSSISMKATLGASDMPVSGQRPVPGGNGGTVSVSNTGSALTLGDGASGMIAQSIGGGGGRVGGGAGNSGSSPFSATVRLGESGGLGASGLGATTTVVNATNGGSILTFGADAPGIVAQSIGGGGGLFGKAVSSIGSLKSTGDGGNGVSSAASGLADLAASGLAAQGNYTTMADLVGLADTLLGNPVPSGPATLPALLTSLSASAGGTANAGAAQSIDVAIGLGATGGTGPLSGGSVQVTNTGDIATTGKMSEGVLAQSIGGGGGEAGIANSAQTSGSTQAAVTLGSSGDASGAGGTVLVTNGAGASIITVGGTAPGIVAQSIGGGGGVAGLSGNSTALLSALSATLGASSLSAGSGGSVTVTEAGTITTLSHDSPGIVAQSIGGGGGLIKTLATNMDAGAGQVIDGGSYPIGLTFAGSYGLSSSDNAGGPVTVSVTGDLSTAGRNSYGIVAQSIGGGGGLVLGGTPNGTNFFGSGPTSGSAAGVTVTLGDISGTAAFIGTGAAGAVGILAQSIGGGGGLAGDTGLTAQRQSFVGSPGHDGNGGPVSITVDQNAEVQTNGSNAPAILAQSIGGGGGRVTNSSFGAYNGSAGGTGYGGAVTVNVSGIVSALGAASPGIYAESAGQGGPGTPAASVISVNVLQGGVVSGGYDFNPGDGYGAGVYVDTGGQTQAAPNTIQNSGTITARAGLSGTAIYSTGGYTVVTNAPSGTITENITLDNNGGAGSCTGSTNCPAQATLGANGRGDINNSGLIQSQSIRLGGGLLTNAGTLDVRGSGTATLDGNYHATTGVLQVGADFAKGTADRLVVTGNVELDPQSSVRVDVANWQKGSVSVLTAGGTLVQDPASAVATNQAYLFGLQTAQSGNTLQVQTVSNIRSAALGLTANQQSVANSLDQIWNAGPGFSGGTAALASVNGPQSYRMALNSLAGASVGGVVAAKQAASDRFTDNLINCELLDHGAAPLEEESCVWLRTTGSQTTLANSGDDPGYHQDGVTYQIGGQQEVAPGWFVGASAGYETSWLVSGDDGSKVSGNSALFGLMLKRQSGPWLLTGVIDGGYGWYQSSRQITVGSLNGQATGSPDVSHAGLHLRAAYEVPLGNWYAKPSFTVEALYRGMSGYSESGSTPFNLNVKSSSDVVGGVTPMIEVGRGGPLTDLGTLRGFLGVGASFYINNDWTSRASFALAPAGADPFSATSQLPDAVGKLNAGLALFTVSGVEAKLTYSADLAPGYAAQSLIGRLAYAF
jgi:hypothetical protein